MRSSLILCLLWGTVDVSSSLDACSMLPHVPQAQVSEETRRSEYHEGHVIRFTCETGYKSDAASQYVCTRGGWVAVRPGTCYSCSDLPDVPHAHISEESVKAPEDYQPGDMIRFTCETNHTSRSPIRYVCVGGGWLAVSQGACYSSSCDPPPADGGVTVKRLPETDGPILPDDILTFSCDDPGKFLDGNAVLICGKDGQWSDPFPFCKDNCEVPEIPRGVRIRPERSAGDKVRKGEKFIFNCRARSHVVHGNATVECLTNGEWSAAFPTCGFPLGCGRPPALADGDTKEISEYSYNHNDKVEYVCQSLYIMEGLRHKTCYNGQWTGNVRCLKPCTVNKQLMSQRNIEFKHRRDDKLYVPHNDRIEFRCIYGTRHDGVVAMQQQCHDGVMLLPTCQ